MELELGLKITRDADDQTCTDFHITKDRAGPVFVSTETDSMFILSAHLKGFEKENINININEDGTRITISGEKVVSETIMRGWRVYKKEEEVKGFRKTFKIPYGVVLDRIKAKFEADNSFLTVHMPKSEKGTRGHGIEEVEAEEENGSEDKEAKEQEKEEFLKRAEQKQDEKMGKANTDENGMPPLKKLKKHPNETEGESKVVKRAQEELLEAKQPTHEAKPDAVVEESAPWVHGAVGEHENGKAAEHQKQRTENFMQKEGEGAIVENKSGFLGPSFYMGSALIASLVMLVVGLVRNKSDKRQR